jgi:hypothetical protein
MSGDDQARPSARSDIGFRGQSGHKFDKLRRPLVTQTGHGEVAYSITSSARAFFIAPGSK